MWKGTIIFGHHVIHVCLPEHAGSCLTMFSMPNMQKEAFECQPFLPLFLALEAVCMHSYYNYIIVCNFIGHSVLLLNTAKVYTCLCIVVVSHALSRHMGDD